MPCKWSSPTSSIFRNFILSIFRPKSMFLGVNSCFFDFLSVFTTFLTGFGPKTASLKIYCSCPENRAVQRSSISRNLMLAFFRRKSTFFDPNSCFFDFLSVFTTFLTGFGLKTGSLKIYWQLLKMRHISKVCPKCQVQRPDFSKSYVGLFSPKINVFWPNFMFFRLFNRFYNVFGRFRAENGKIKKKS